jgi:hypothetical protein
MEIIVQDKVGCILISELGRKGQFNLKGQMGFINTYSSESRY